MSVSSSSLSSSTASGPASGSASGVSGASSDLAFFSSWSLVRGRASTWSWIVWRWLSASGASALGVSAGAGGGTSGAVGARCPALMSPIPTKNSSR